MFEAWVREIIEELLKSLHLENEEEGENHGS